MFYMSEKDYERKMRKIRIKNKSYERRQLVKEAKRKKDIKLPTTTKLITLYLFIVLNIVLVYSLIAMWHFENLTYLGTLITDVLGQILVFFIYSIKSTKENTKGGITYETAMAKLQHSDKELDLSIKEIDNAVG